MLNAIRLARAQPAAALFSSPRPYHIGRRSCSSSSGLKFRQPGAGAKQPQKDDNIEQQQKQQQQINNPNAKTGDVMSHSFGEGYATRSDEEGFGGTTCNTNDAASKIEQDRVILENNPAYDKSQGSEVAEKEKARHQTTAES